MEKTRGKVHHRYGNVVLLLQHQQPRAFLIRSFKVISVCCLVCTFPEWAESLTDMGKGKHFIGDFLPPEELDKFMETFKALKVRFPLNSPVLHSNRRHLKFPCISFRGKLGWLFSQELMCKSFSDSPHRRDWMRDFTRCAVYRRHGKCMSADYSKTCFTGN